MGGTHTACATALTAQDKGWHNLARRHRTMPRQQHSSGLCPCAWFTHLFALFLSIKMKNKRAVSSNYTHILHMDPSAQKKCMSCRDCGNYQPECLHCTDDCTSKQRTYKNHSPHTFSLSAKSAEPAGCGGFSPPTLHCHPRQHQRPRHHRRQFASVHVRKLHTRSFSFRRQGSRPPIG